MKTKGIQVTLLFWMFILTHFILAVLLFSCTDDESSSIPPTSTPTATATPTATPVPNEPPDTEIISAPETVTSWPAEFSYIGSDAEDDVGLLTYSYRLDNEPWSPWVSDTTVSYYSLDKGEHTFEVKARDTEGAEDPVPATWDFTVTAETDDQPPETWIVSGVSGTINTSEVTFVYTGSDDFTAAENLLFSVLIDNGSWSEFSRSNQTDLSGLSEGEHYFAVRAMDEVGNVDPTPDFRSFTVDLTYYGVSLTPATQNVSVNAGDEAVATVTLRNSGTLDADYELYLTSNHPNNWSSNFCLSNGTCVVGSITLSFTAGASDYFTIHVQTDSADASGTQGKATLHVQCLQDSSISASSTVHVTVK